MPSPGRRRPFFSLRDRPVNDFEPLLGATFRANPAYELVVFDRLSAAERELLADLRRDPGFYGVLKPRGAAEAGALDEGRGDGRGLGVKAVDRETALLVLTLGTPGEAAPLPAYVRGLFGEDSGRAVAQLVADGVLEVAAGGGFVSGAAALHLLAPASSGREERGGAIAALSVEALRYAQALPIDEPLRLSGRLYGYNRRPLTPRWQRLLAGPSAVPRFLGYGGGGPSAAGFARRWLPQPPSPAWISWRARSGRGRLPASGPMYKLYVSPRTEWLGEGGFLAVAAALAEAGAPQWKVGADAAGLLRADKIVAYFADFEALAAAADRLHERLAGVAAQGVPFTAEIGGAGLLSWGVDPPRGEALPWGQQESWRLWLTHRLARALIAAQSGRDLPNAAARSGRDLPNAAARSGRDLPNAAAQSGRDLPNVAGAVEPWRFAVERLRLEGIDTDTWTPGAGLWRES